MEIEKVTPLPKGAGYLVNDSVTVQRSDMTVNGLALREWFRSGGRLTPMGASLEEAQNHATRELEKMFVQTMKSVVGNASAEERDTWTAKERAAYDIAQGESNAMIEAEAEATGESVTELANVIIAKAERYRLLSGRAAGQKRRDVKLINQCETVQAVHDTLALIQQQRIDNASDFEV